MIIMIIIGSPTESLVASGVYYPAPVPESCGPSRLRLFPEGEEIRELCFAASQCSAMQHAREPLPPYTEESANDKHTRAGQTSSKVSAFKKRRMR